MAGWILILTSGLLNACERNGQSALHPHGLGAARIAETWWLMLAGAGAVFLLVVVLLFLAFTHKGQRAAMPASSPSEAATKWVVAGGVLLPTVLLVPLLIITLKTLAALVPGEEGRLADLTITGRQWWWDVGYAERAGEQPVRTANEIHIPVGRPVRIRLLASDVIHSFWVPELQGKIDMVPGKENTIWIRADTVGVYRGVCAEYCGLQHARMQFRVIVQPAEVYQAWLGEQRRPARSPSDSLTRAGQAVFMRSGCAGCHVIRGTPAQGSIGPDLTHVASRATLGAGTVPNTRGHMAGWVANSQGVKPGNLMPAIRLRPPDLHALLAYLGSLR
jgi:cytochrome c oxidase subunit II